MYFRVSQKSIFMKRVALFLLFGIFSIAALAQTQDAAQLYKDGKQLLQQGDYDNAIMVLNNALQQDPKNLDIQKDLAFANFLNRDYASAINVSKKIIEQPGADEQAYQILGMCYKAIAEYKQAADLYEKGIKKFPNSGVLYNEYGELLAMNKNLDKAIQYWEKGIEADPNYSSNYYNAAMYYSQSNTNLFWVMYYGEIFVNLESYTTRTAGMKSTLLDAYKKLYTQFKPEQWTSEYKKTPFALACMQVLKNSIYQIATGVTPDNLLAVRTRFVLDWYNGGLNQQFPSRLFDQWQYFLRDGMFEAYNQWIFGAAASPAQYQTWVQQHASEANAFKQYQSNRIFKIPMGQFYHQ
ncbi:tetratricopeptide repeat protein [Hydrotalea sandarakina]|jgi:Tfp pilus assembly protein PilF|uniref:Tetratricopeptide repeat protein n=2 Tax=Hydrotalea sandarakina TaxID=1004304 RepID=A0A2W7RPS1_9BACT|nr:tetratricopeptide repeat protein [Hydrotalea sandarakina]